MSIEQYLKVDIEYSQSLTTFNSPLLDRPLLRKDTLTYYTMLDRMFGIDRYTTTYIIFKVTEKLFLISRGLKTINILHISNMRMRIYMAVRLYYGEKENNGEDTWSQVCCGRFRDNWYSRLLRHRHDLDVNSIVSYIQKVIYTLVRSLVVICKSAIVCYLIINLAIHSQICYWYCTINKFELLYLVIENILKLCKYRWYLW